MRVHSTRAEVHHYRQVIYQTEVLREGNGTVGVHKENATFRDSQIYPFAIVRACLL